MNQKYKETLERWAKERDEIVKYREQGLTYDEIGSKFGTTGANIKRRYERALEKQES